MSEGATNSSNADEPRAKRLLDAAEVRLQIAVGAGEHETSNLDGRPFINLQEGAGTRKKGPAYRVLEPGWLHEAGFYGYRAILISLKHPVDKMPILRIVDQKFSDQKKAQLISEGFLIDEKHSFLVEIGKEYEIVQYPDDRPMVVKKSSTIAQTVSRKGTNELIYDLYTKNISPDAAELEDVFTAVTTVPIALKM